MLSLWVSEGSPAREEGVPEGGSRMGLRWVLGSSGAWTGKKGAVQHGGRPVRGGAVQGGKVMGGRFRKERSSGETQHFYVESWSLKASDDSNARLEFWSHLGELRRVQKAGGVQQFHPKKPTPAFGVVAGFRRPRRFNEETRRRENK